MIGSSGPGSEQNVPATPALFWFRAKSAGSNSSGSVSVSWKNIPTCPTLDQGVHGTSLSDGCRSRLGREVSFITTLRHTIPLRLFTANQDSMRLSASRSELYGVQALSIANSSASYFAHATAKLTLLFLNFAFRVTDFTSYEEKKHAYLRVMRTTNPIVCGGGRSEAPSPRFFVCRCQTAGDRELKLSDS